MRGRDEEEERLGEAEGGGGGEGEVGGWHTGTDVAAGSVCGDVCGASDACARDL